MSKFKVGDLIIGNESADNEYKLTKKGVICRVEDLSGEDNIVGIRIVESPFSISNANRNKTWYVNVECFDKYEKAISKIEKSDVSMKNVISKPSTLKLNITEGKRYKSFGKHFGATVETVTTTITLEGKTASATCDKDNYNERQGILEALGNMFYGNFDREYEKYVRQRDTAFKETCKCAICGELYTNPEDARSCENDHKEKRTKKFNDYLLRKEAIKRIREAEHENKVEELMAEIYAKRNADKKPTTKKKTTPTKKND